MTLPPFLRRLLALLGFRKEDEDKKTAGRPRKGFSMQVPAPNSNVLNGPVMSRCTYGNGGVQGLKWYSERLRADEDGDIAQEFLYEVVSETAGSYNPKVLKLKLQIHTKPVKINGPLCTVKGNVHQFVEYQGATFWA